MKYLYMLLIFLVGVAVGRWSTSESGINSPSKESVTQVSSISILTPIGSEKTTPPAKENFTYQNIVPASGAGNLARNENHVREKQMRELSDLLWEAKNKDDIEEQNRLFAEMEKLDPKHEKVFEAKVTFLQEDDNWDGAYSALKECVTVIPNSTYCLRRLANIRSSTNEDKLRYGAECLQVSPNDPLCLVDLAIAFHTKGDFEKAKFYFEQALNLRPGSEGYHRDYILVQYGATLERLNLNQRAKAAYAEACKLRNKMACEKLNS